MYDAANRLTQNAGTSFSYDATGNLASDGLTSFTWSARNELAGLSGATSASFAYDGVGKRRNKATGGTSTNFLFDGFNLVQELSGAVPTANFMIGLAIDEVWTRTDQAGTRTTLADGLGSVIAQAGAAGSPDTQFTYEPFGNTNATGSASTTIFHFTGRERDSVVPSLYYYRARYYAPDTGRFVSEDPIELDGGVNSYAYVQNNPVNLVDPFGLCGAQPEKPCRPQVPYRGDLPPGHVPWNVPYSPDVERAYGGATGGPFNNDLANVSLRFGDNPWSNCVRGCLLSAWDRCEKRYIPNFYIAHTTCYAICTGSLVLGGK